MNPSESDASAHTDSATTHPKKRVYGRRLGRPMHAARLRTLESLLPALQIPLELLCEDAKLDPASLFPNLKNSAKIHFEIGFGSGEHLHYLMKEFPHDIFIGAEPYINGMTAFLKEFETPPDNLRVHMDDALMVLNSLQDHSVDCLYILNPDPWPKSRHHKRRIVSEENLKVFARVLKPGGMMLQTTDVDELAEWMLAQTLQNPDFEWLAETPADWVTPPNGWMATRYETKGKQAGRVQKYLVFKRI